VATAARTANLLGAVALAVTDRIAEPPSGRSATDAAALSALDQFLGHPPIERLAQVVGLSHSGAVRMVDRLEAEGLVRRGPGGDGRTTTVALTAAGRREAGRIASARADVLRDALRDLDAGERDTLGALLGRVLVAMMRAPGATRWACRRCDLVACGRAAGHCPVEQEARHRYGDTS
jgi:DNA-binding MarR family transcriptional regulator